MDLMKNGMTENGSGKERVAGSFQHDCVLSDSIKGGEFLDQVRAYQLKKKSWLYGAIHLNKKLIKESISEISPFLLHGINLQTLDDDRCVAQLKPLILLHLERIKLPL